MASVCEGEEPHAKRPREAAADNTEEDEEETCSSSQGMLSPRSPFVLKEAPYGGSPQKPLGETAAATPAQLGSRVDPTETPGVVLTLDAYPSSAVRPGHDGLSYLNRDHFYK